MLGAGEVGLTVTIATVFGEIKEPKARLRAVRAGRAVLNEIADKAVAECREAGDSWRAIAQELGESHTSAYRHHVQSGVGEQAPVSVAEGEEADA